MLKNVCLILVVCFIYTSCKSNNSHRVYNILDFGAVNDTSVLSTVAVQKAIDKCSEKGGVVLFPVGKYLIGTIKLKSNVELNISEGAELLGSTLLTDYATDNQGAIEAPAFNKCLIYAENASNVKITGKGVINGRGTRVNFPVKLGDILGERPMLIRFVNCREITFSEISLQNSASWCVHLVECEDITAKNVTIDSRVNTNNDGFDLDGCKNVLIEKCNIRSGDDAICPKSTTTKLCENIVIKNCRVESHTSAFKTGTSSRGGFKNITISDCDFSNTRMGVIKLLIVDGGIMENITINNIVMNNVEGPIFIRLGNRGRKYDVPTEQIYDKNVNHEGTPVGSIKNIRISNIRGTVISEDKSRCGIMITGIPGYSVENIQLENIKISFPGGGTIEDSNRIIDEDLARYPEQYFFGTLPSWGAFIRHARNIEFKNVTMSMRTPDFREKIVLNDVEGFLNR